MLRSLSSAVSGLRAHQTKMDVIGNNIANVNTTAYKSNRATFQDVFYQTTAPASAAGTSKGGTNASQIGYGSKVATIDVLNTIGGMETTDRALDLYNSGEGYFIVGDADGSNTSFTRAGNFYLDSAGSLVDSSGNYVKGTMTVGSVPSDVAGCENITIDQTTETYSDIAVGKDGIISAVASSTGATVQLAQLALAKFPNADGLSLDGNNLAKETANSGVPIVGFAGTNSIGTLVSGGLEMSNVDISKEFTDMITTQRGFQANSRIITVSDEMLEELVNLKR